MITTTPLHISGLLTVAAVVMFRQDDPGKQGLGLGEGKNHENIKLPLPIFVGI